MELTAGNIGALLKLTVTNPGQVAQLLLGLNLPRSARFAALGIAAALSGVVLWATYTAFPMQMDGQTFETPGPIIWAFMVGAGTLLLSGLIFVIGRLAGGKADFPDLVLLMSWFQVMQLALYLGQILLLLAVPPLGVLATLLSFGLTIWVLAHFIRVAHVFSGVMGPIFGIIGVAVVLTLLLLSGA